MFWQQMFVLSLSPSSDKAKQLHLLSALCATKQRVVPHPFCEKPPPHLHLCVVMQAEEERDDMEKVKLDNKRILFNLLPAHVAQHFLMSNPRNMVSNHRRVQTSLTKRGNDSETTRGARRGTCCFKGLMGQTELERKLQNVACSSVIHPVKH